MKIKTKIKSGDKVIITKGKDLGKSGLVQKLFLDKSRILVAGINIVKKHIKPRGNQKGGIFEMENPISISNVAIICPNCKKPAKIGFELKGGIKQRICKKCKTVITNTDKSKK
jgi:large subunit ribosomal protein L24